MTLAHEEFRALFPAVDRLLWFDTPGCAPGMTPVADAVRSQLSEWIDGEFDWIDWDREPERSRSLFAGLLRVDGGGATAGRRREPGRVATVNSVGDAVATIARSLPSGTVVASELEYQSLLFPFEPHEERGVRLRRAAAIDGLTRTEQLIDALDESCVLVAVSDCLSSNGSRLDLDALAAACRSTGAELLVDVTQSLGVVDYDFSSIRPDYIVAHGYKWLGAPRGAAWLWASQRAWARLQPHAPSWRNRPRPFDYFGGVAGEGLDPLRKADGSHAWFSWSGANAALERMGGLDFGTVERHASALRERWEAGAFELGYRPVARERGSHISVVTGPEADPDDLRESGLRLLCRGGRLRAGFHYFNSGSDVDRGLEVLARAVRRG